MALTKHLSSKQSANKDCKAEDDQNEKQACKPTAPSGSQSKTTTAPAKQSTGGGRAKGKQPQEPVELCNICKVTGKGPVWPCNVCGEGRCVEICLEKVCRKQICKPCADKGECNGCRKCTSTICKGNTKQPAALEVTQQVVVRRRRPWSMLHALKSS
jgi:hypothetical protein